MRAGSVKYIIKTHADIPEDSPPTRGFAAGIQEPAPALWAKDHELNVGDFLKYR